MLFDSHSHTEVSADSEMTAAAALAAAGRAGVGLVFTEHLDWDFPGEQVFEFDPQAYWQRYEALRGDRLRLGVEIGLEPGTEARSEVFVAQAPFDLVIGSIHLLEHHDLYYPDYYQTRPQAQVYADYYTTMAQQVRRCAFCDVLGHIDYICRYAPYDNPEIQYATHRELIDDVLQAVVDTGKVLELNTRRLGSRLALKELVPVYARYHELGGRYVTLGSDAHTPDAIAANFTVAQDFAAQLGLEIVTFKARQLDLCQ